MGVYIEGMELPKDKEIFLRIDEKGEVYVYGSYPTELHKAVPVQPHGDLIDRDELKKKELVIDGIIHYYEPISIEEAPVIIPASKEDE